MSSEKSSLSPETATKQGVAAALKSTAKGQLCYDTSWSYSLDSLQVRTVMPAILGYFIAYRGYLLAKAPNLFSSTIAMTNSNQITFISLGLFC